MYDNPGYAGSSSPKILVLGFSKGATQIEAAKQGNYDEEAFKGMRPRLQRLLEKIELMPTDRSIDEMLTAKEQQFGGASLVRCSLCKMDGKNCVTRGSMVTDSFNVPQIYDEVIRQCASIYLKDMPDSIELVLLLGTNNLYIRRSTRLFRELYPDFELINNVAFRARTVLWIYVAHPSPANGHFESWIKAEKDNLSGRKCLLAAEALAMGTI